MVPVFKMQMGDSWLHSCCCDFLPLSTSFLSWKRPAYFIFSAERSQLAWVYLCLFEDARKVYGLKEGVRKRVRDNLDCWLDAKEKKKEESVWGRNYYFSPFFDPRGRPQAGNDHYIEYSIFPHVVRPSVRPSVQFFNTLKQNKSSLPTEWIIDKSCLVFTYFRAFWWMWKQKCHISLIKYENKRKFLFFSG